MPIACHVMFNGCIKINIQIKYLLSFINLTLQRNQNIKKTSGKPIQIAKVMECAEYIRLLLYLSCLFRCFLSFSCTQKEKKIRIGNKNKKIQPITRFYYTSLLFSVFQPLFIHCWSLYFTLFDIQVHTSVYVI